MKNIKEEKITEERIEQIAKNITSEDYMRGYGDAEQKMIEHFKEIIDKTNKKYPNANNALMRIKKEVEKQWKTKLKQLIFMK